MRKFLSIILVTFVSMLIIITQFGCINSNTNNDGSTIWESFGNGVGAFVPEPYQEYEINASTSYISIEVHGITENDFYDYVNRCKNKGFVGNIGTATSPDIYFMAEHNDGYELEVFYYETNAYFYIYASKK